MKNKTFSLIHFHTTNAPILSPCLPLINRLIMGQHVKNSKIPTILIFSNVSEGKASPSDLEKIIEPSILYDTTKVKIMQINSATKSQVKKCLQQIACKEKLPIPTGLIDSIYNSCGGDLRNAIMTLQFQILGLSKKSNFRLRTEKNTRLPSKYEKAGNGCYDRDIKLFPFHALGKLLYAKRRVVSQPQNLTNHATCLTDRPPLTFVPEHVVNTSGLSHESTLTFLSYHCPDFYTNIAELSDGFDLFSDAAVLLHRKFDVSKINDISHLFKSRIKSNISSRHSFLTNNFHWIYS